ncbi:hypothetical protein [Citrobacter portucalensis]|uniref:hypothetical protein n=1 Tax=Citrobacter portucalensis TaxID=1639133 RepID=UPI0039FD5EC8
MGEFDSAVDARLLSCEMPQHILTEAHERTATAGVYAELYRLREEIKGPSGFDTWKDAAIAERKARVELEKAGPRFGDIDYLSAMSAFHSNEWHKMGPITGYMHGWNAFRAAMLQGNYRDLSQPVDPQVAEYEKMMNQAGNSPVIPDCWCRTCRPVTMSDMRFVVCPECGNKRCPRANDHRNACTGSNDPGQIGNAYPASPQQETDNG